MLKYTQLLFLHEFSVRIQKNAQIHKGSELCFNLFQDVKCGLLSLILWLWFQNIAGFIITTLSFLKAKCNYINGTEIN